MLWVLCIIACLSIQWTSNLQLAWDLHGNAVWQFYLFTTRMMMVYNLIHVVAMTPVWIFEEVRCTHELELPPLPPRGRIWKVTTGRRSQSLHSKWRPPCVSVTRWVLVNVCLNISIWKPRNNWRITHLVFWKGWFYSFFTTRLLTWC